jgi:hypothetical protein
MKNKALTFQILLSVLMLSGMLSCSDKSGGFSEPSDMKDRAVKLITDWRNRTQGVDIPPHYTVKTGELHLDSISEQTFLIPHSFQPGPHSIYVYNPAGNILIDGTTASIAVEDEYIKDLPGWFFTSARHVIIEDEKHYDIPVVMQQQIRELAFVLLVPEAFADSLQGISASLNGVASQLDIPSGEVIGLPTSVRLDFIKKTDTTFVATTRLLGLIGDTQMLACSFTFSNDHLPVMHKLFELHTLLEDFHTDKITPMQLTVAILPEPIPTENS